jgi:hypothetical protein
VDFVGTGIERNCQSQAGAIPKTKPAIKQHLKGEGKESNNEQKHTKDCSNLDLFGELLFHYYLNHPDAD